jgi:hypothetical protein
MSRRGFLAALGIMTTTVVLGLGSEPKVRSCVDQSPETWTWTFTAPPGYECRLNEVGKMELVPFKPCWRVERLSSGVFKVC